MPSMTPDTEQRYISAKGPPLRLRLDQWDLPDTITQACSRRVPHFILWPCSPSTPFLCYHVHASGHLQGTSGVRLSGMAKLVR